MAEHMDYLEITTYEQHPLHIPRTFDLPHRRRSIYVGPFIGNKDERLRQRHAINRYDVEWVNARREHGLCLVYWPSLKDAQMYRGRGSIFSIIRPADFAPHAGDLAAIDALLAAVPDAARQDWFDGDDPTIGNRQAQLSMFDDDVEDEAVCDD